MIFYLGDKVDDLIDNKVRLARNKAKSWDYGYDASIDVVIISKDGTLGEIYNISGINIGLPQQPEKEFILNNDKTAENQKFRREELVEELTDLSISNWNRKQTGTEKEKSDKAARYLNSLYEKHADYIETEYDRREKGLWIYVKGFPVYIPGTYYYGVQWVREETEYPNFRVIQNELMIFWEACKADDRCFGMQYVKNRRIGASYLAVVELLESGTINEDKILGIVSKKGDDSKKIFNRLIKGFKRLPCFFQPLWDGTNTPKKELILDVPTKRRAKNEIVSDDGLGSSISWHNTEINAMDGDAIFRSLLDESGKYPPDVPFDKYWYIVKTSHTKGIRITGKSMVVSTVNAKNKGGDAYESIWNDSDVEKRDGNGQTTSGLYRIFIAAEYCLEGMFDEYGFTIIEDPTTEVRTDEGKITKVGSRTFLKNKAESLSGDPEKLNEHKRQFPDTVYDAFRDESGNCAFNSIKLAEQVFHNEHEMMPDEIETGNFSWENGIADGNVKWNPDPNGRFWIKKGCHPPEEFRNKKEKKYINGVLAWAPIATHIGCFGVDPYNVTKSATKGSRGAIHLSTKMNTSALPNNTFILEYLDRAPKIEMFFEDVLMAMVYFSMPMLCELSNYEFLRMIKNRGYRHFSMNNPFKNFADLIPTELEFGGCPAQNAKIGTAQANVVNSYIEDHVGIAMEDTNRPKGTIGNMVFTRTVTQWQKVDLDNRTNFDAYISSSLSLVGNQKIETKPIPPKRRGNPFTKYNNSGNLSTAKN
ncbi:hypothetical protein [Flavobacterium sp. FlaQc-50]|uniref:hypothetical protein n=1 Tax=unclassified Flavobacterium TaxID=196869 RepID=UPI003757084D